MPTLDGKTRSAYETDFLHEITKTMDEHYFRKHKDCMAITLAIDWVDNSGHQYACPMCNKMYKPWVVAEGNASLTKANKVT